MMMMMMMMMMMIEQIFPQSLKDAGGFAIAWSLL